MSRVSSDNPFEQIYNAMLSTVLAAAQEMAVGTVNSVTSSGIVLSLDGDTAGTKKYTCNRTERFSAGDRVLCARKSGTWVVICKIGNPGGPVAKTAAMTQDVGIDESGKLYTEPGEAYTLPTASSTQLGGVKPVTKTSDMTQDVGVDSEGKLYTTPPGAYNLPTASTSALGGIKTSEAYSSTKHKAKVAVDTGGVLYAEAYTLPTAGASTLGGVKPVAKTTAMTQDVGVDSAGKLYTTPPGAYDLPTASTSALGGIKTSEAYNSTKHTVKVAVNSSGALYAEAYSLPTAGASTLGGVKPVAKTSAMTQDVGVDSAGKLYTTPGAYDMPTASTTTLGGVKTSASYSASTHTVDIAVDSTGKLHAAAQAAGNVSRLYAGTSTTSYAELNNSKAFLPSGTGFDLGSITYPWQSLYFAKQGVSSYYLRAESGNIRPAATTTLTDYFNLGSSTYPFNALYVKKLYVNGKEISTNAAGDIVASTPDASQMWDGTVPEVTE